MTISRFLMVLCVLSIASGAARAAGPLKKVRLKNGFRLLTREDHGLPLVGVCLGVGAGSAQDPDALYGAAKLTALTLLTVPDEDPAHAVWKKIVELSGRETGVTCEWDYTTVRLLVPTAQLTPTLTTLARLFHQDAPPAAALEEMRSGLQKKLAQSAEEPIGSGLLDREFERLAYGSHPYGHPEDGTPETLKNVTRESIASFKKTWYVPNNAVLALTGDVDTKAAVALAQQLFGEAPASTFQPQRTAAVTPPDKPRVEIRDLPVDRPVARIGFLAPPVTQRDAYAVEVLRSLLADGHSSRLHQRLVDHDARVKRVNSHYPLLADTSAVLFDLRLKSDDFSEVLNDVIAEIERLRNRDVDHEELERTKTYLKAQLALRLQSAAVWADRLATFELVDEMYTAESFVTDIDRVTPQQVRQAAQKYLDPDRVIAVCLRPPTAGAAAATEDTKLYDLPGGMRLLVSPRSSSEVVGVTLLARAGVRTEPAGQRGIARLLALKLGHGSTRRHTASELALRLEGIGSELDVEANEDGIVLSVNATRASLEEVLTVVHEIASEPEFSPGEVAAQRDRLAERLREQAQDPEQVGLAELRKSVFGDHPYATSPTEQSVAAIRPEDLRAYWESVYRPDRMILSVVGPVDPERVKEQVQAVCPGASASGAASPIATSPVPVLTESSVRTLPGTRGGDQLFIGFALPAESRKDFPAATVCFRELGWGTESLLGQAIAKLDPTYQLSSLSFHMEREGTQVTMAYRMKAGTAKDAIKGLDAALARLSDPGPSDQAVADTRDLVLNVFLTQKQNNLLEAMQRATYLDISGSPHMFARLERAYQLVDREKVRAVASRYFKYYRAVVIEGK